MLRRARGPAAQHHEDRLDLIAPVGQLIDLDRGGRRKLAALDDAGGLQPLQSLSQDVGRQAAQVLSQVAETPWPHHEFSYHQQRPALADQVEPMRGAAGVVIAARPAWGLISYFF
ncbi:hypothetical protein D3C81_1959350 [compost metagenome]